MGDVLISSLMIGDCSSRICVRASRFWDFYDPQDETKLLHADLVMIDEEGNSVHAQMYPPLTETFRPLIKEGNVYNISCVQVKKPNKMYRPVESDIMINFTKWTTVEEVVEIPPAFPVCTYTLIPMEKIPSRVDYREYFTDVIGVVTVISNVTSFQAKARQTESLKRTITIRDESNALLNIVLWGERATSFPADQVHKDGQISPQVVIFVGTLVKSYAGNISLSGGSSCKWYINPDVPETKHLMDSMKNMHQPVTLDQQATHTQPKTFAAEHKKVSDIKYLNPFKHKKMEWLVTVKVMKIDKSWMYNCCRKCMKTSKPYGDMYKCIDTVCGVVGAHNPRYKVAITAGDETGDTEFVLFGRMAQRLIGKTVDALIAENPRGFIPNEITKLLEKVFVFNVSFTENTISSGNVSFQVNAVVAEVDDGNPVSMAPTGSQTSSAMITQGASSSIHATPQKDVAFALSPPAASALSPPAVTSKVSHASSTTPCKPGLHDPKPPTTPPSGKSLAEDTDTSHKADTSETDQKLISATTTHARPRAASHDSEHGLESKVGPADTSELGKRKSAPQKRPRASPGKRTAKKLFVDEDPENDSGEDCVSATE